MGIRIGRRDMNRGIGDFMAGYNPDPWLVIGDFNEIVSQEEKFGAVLTREGQMEAFREAFEDCSLCDLGYRGSWFT